MLRSPILKYVAGPQSFAYMPPILAGCSVGTGMFLWFFGQIAGFGVIPGILIGLCACVASVVIGFKEPHIHYLLLARQKFMCKTDGIIKTKGKTYFVCSSISTASVRDTVWRYG